MKIRRLKPKVTISARVRPEVKLKLERLAAKARCKPSFYLATFLEETLQEEVA